MSLSDREAPPRPPAPTPVRFSRLSEVARGGMGRIDAAHDPVLGRRVAIKSLHPELLQDPLAAIRFSEEAQITGQLEHPNVAPIYDLGEDENGPFIVMKLLAGRSLGQLLFDAAGHPRRDAEGVDQLHRFVQMVVRLCDALSFAHSRGVIHCDVKPDNIMIGEHGQVYLMDWGVALLLSDRTAAEHSTSEAPLEATAPSEAANWATRDSFVRVTGSPEDTGAFRGTPAYMSPEQILGKTELIDARTDVFGLGGVLFEILTGHPPNDPARLRGPAFNREHTLPLKSTVWEQLPPELCRIAIKCLSPLQENRYPSVEALKADLEQFLKGGGWFETAIFKPGESIVAEGAPGDTAYIIQSGNCDVFKDIQGQRVFIRQLGPGAVFGEAAVFTGGSRTASVVAVDTVTVKVITGAALNRELDQNPWLAAFVRSLAGLFREADAAISQRTPAKAEP
ncbi:MAG: cyclic nucleotide-binding domain-containing protein [Polyangiaceae bacterium]|nr:cyclic nucleotide-binding domain-containing protein [Polyangiaceae bacterium]